MRSFARVYVRESHSAELFVCVCVCLPLVKCIVNEGAVTLANFAAKEVNFALSVV